MAVDTASFIFDVSKNPNFQPRWRSGSEYESASAFGLGRNRRFYEIQILFSELGYLLCVIYIYICTKLYNSKYSY